MGREMNPLATPLLPGPQRASAAILVLRNSNKWVRASAIPGGRRLSIVAKLWSELPN